MMIVRIGDTPRACPICRASPASIATVAKMTANTVPTSICPASMLPASSNSMANNVATLAGWFPGPVADVPVLGDTLGSGYWQPWFLALGVGYLATALYNWSNPQIRKSERVVYGLGGLTCLFILSPWFPTTELYPTRLFLVGGLLHVIPMGFDVLADIVLILRRTG